MSLGSPLRLLRAAMFAAVCLALSAAGHCWLSRQSIPFRDLCIAYVALFAVALALTKRERSFVGIAGVVLLSELVLHVYFCVAQASVVAAGTTGSGGSAADAAATAAWLSALICVPGLRPGQLPPGMTVESLLRIAGLDPALAAHAPGVAGTASAVTNPDHLMAGMSMAGMSMSGMNGSMSTMGSTVGMDLGGGLWGMLAVHLVAGLISAWWLRRGEAAVFAMLSMLAMTAFGFVLRLALLLALVFGVRAPSGAPVRRARDPWWLPQLGRCALWDVVVRRGPPMVAVAG